MFVNARRYDRFLEDMHIPEPENLFSPPNGSVASRGFGSGLGLRHHDGDLGQDLVFLINWTSGSVIKNTQKVPPLRKGD